LSDNLTNDLRLGQFDTSIVKSLLSAPPLQGGNVFLQQRDLDLRLKVVAHKVEIHIMGDFIPGYNAENDYQVKGFPIISAVIQQNQLQFAYAILWNENTVQNDENVEYDENELVQQEAFYAALETELAAISSLIMMDVLC
jgi:hypothetical protein